MIMDMEEPAEVVVEMVDQEGWPTKGWTLSTRQRRDKNRGLLSYQDGLASYGHIDRLCQTRSDH